MISSIENLERHNQSLLKTAYEVFSKELNDTEFHERLPLVQLCGCENAPGACHLYLLAPSGKNRKTILFLEEMAQHWLTPAEQLTILSSRNLTFYPLNSKRSFFFVELLLHIPEEKALSDLLRQWPSISNEIKLGVFSSGQAKHILEMKRLSPAGRTSFIYESIVNLIQRYPKRFSHDIFRDIQHFLVHCREEFRQIRDVRHLCRIICAHYLFQKALEHDSKAYPHKRHIYIKFMKTHLHFPFGLKKVVGIAIAINSLRDYECFELRHILKAIQRIIPNTEAHKDSFYLHKSEDPNLLMIYLEIEKARGSDFSLSDLKCLKKELALELKNSIEYLSPSLFLPPNEEELIRNIILLSQELRYTKDLPQAMISFQEQKNDFLKFSVTLLRVILNDTPSLQELSRKLPKNVRLIHQRAANVGFLRKKYIKEANVFSLEIENQLFIRKNHSVDLVKARQFVVKAMEKMLNNFRDFNGGLLLKQNEQLEAIKMALGMQAKLHEFLLENLFYSLSPSIMQTNISAEEGKKLSALFIKALEIELPNNEEYLLLHEVNGDAAVMVLKTNIPEIKEKITEGTKPLFIDSLKVAQGAVDVDRMFYICFLLTRPDQNELQIFLAKIQECLQAWKQKKMDRQVIRLHLPRAAQSLDPRIGADRTSGIVIKMLYEGLTRLSSDNKIEYALAKEVIVSDNFKKFVFKLKKTHWSNGYPLTAHDFEYAWKKILEPDFSSPYAFLFFPIKHAEAAKKGEIPVQQVGVKALDELTLSVELEYPCKYFLGLTANWMYSPLCREIDQKHPGWAYHSGESYVCNGPFKLDIWKLNDDLQMVKNPFYWDAKNVGLDRIYITIVENEKTAYKMFLQNELDWIGDPLTKIPPSELEQLIENKKIITDDNHYGLFWLQLNIKKLPFNNAKLRRAFHLGVDREELIAKALKSHDLPAFSFFHRPSYVKDTFSKADPGLALKLFEEGLKELKLGVKDLPPLVISHSDIEEQEYVAKEIGKQWSELFGLEVRYERLLWNQFFEVLSRGGFMAAPLAWYPRFDDPIYYFNLFIFREHSVNVTNWKDPSFNDLIDKARQCSDEKKYLSYLFRCEKILMKEIPVIPLFYQKFRYMKNPRLTNYILSNTNQIDLRNAYLKNPLSVD